MRYPVLPSTLAATTLLLAAVVVPPAPIHAQGQPPAPATPRPAQPRDVPPAPYKPVPITLPTGMNDPSFDAFRGDLAQIARKKDRAALARIVAAGFFWIPEDTDLADRSRPAIDNLAKALALDSRDSFGWDSFGASAPRRSWSSSIERNSAVMLPSPKPSSPLRWMNSKNTGPTMSWLKICISNRGWPP